MAAPRYLKERIFLGAALTASVIGGSAYFAHVSPDYSTTTQLTTTAPGAIATFPIVPAGTGNVAAAPVAPSSAPVKPKATVTAKRSRAS